MKIEDEQIDPIAEGPAPAPIVIVQRGRPGWGRELLLLALLVAAAGYILVEEYRGPVVIVRDAPRPTGRLIDPNPVAPVAAVPVVVRTGADGPPLALPAVPEPAAVSPIVDEEGPEPADGPPPDVQPAPGEPAAADVPDEVAGPSTTPIPAMPDRSSSEILWDEARRVAAPAWGRAEADDRGEGDPAGGLSWPPAYRPPTREQRVQFLLMVSQVVQEHGRSAGGHLDALCRSSGTGLPPELDLLETRLGSNFRFPGCDLERTILLLRHAGAPEPYLLDRLSEQMARTVGARHGPRNRQEARVFAARKLLSIPLDAAERGRR